MEGNGDPKNGIRDNGVSGNGDKRKREYDKQLQEKR